MREKNEFTNQKFGTAHSMLNLTKNNRNYCTEKINHKA